jgi:Lon protease-like protein
MASNTKYDDTAMRAALRQYLDLKKNVEPDKEVRRRAKNVGMKLIRIYKDNAPTVAEIKDLAVKLGYRIKTRPGIVKKKGSRAKQVAAEIKARIAARTFSATGWFPAVEALGGSPKIAQRIKGPKRGSIAQKRGLASVQVTLVNDQPGAEQTASKKGNAMQQALDAETADMLKYIMRKQQEAAKKAGL